MGIAILIVAVLAIAGAVVWFFLKNKKEPSVEQHKPEEPPVDEPKPDNPEPTPEPTEKVKS